MGPFKMSSTMSVTSTSSTATSSTMSVASSSTVATALHQVEREAEIIWLANDTGIDLLDTKLYNEASYHFNLALENVLGMYAAGNAAAAAAAAAAASAVLTLPDSPPKTPPPPDVVSMESLGTSVKITPLSPAHDTQSRMYWMNCASLALMHNSSLIYYQTKSYARARKVLNFAFHLIQNELNKTLEKCQQFYQHNENVSLVMSLHYMLSKVLLAEGVTSLDLHNVDEDLLQEAYRECETALELAANFLVNEPLHSLKVAQLFSWMAYCMLLVQYPTTTSTATSLYQSAKLVYQSFRLEGSNSTQDLPAACA